jgi:hypothetical protein
MTPVADDEPGWDAGRFLPGSGRRRLLAPAAPGQLVREAPVVFSPRISILQILIEDREVQEGGSS